MPRARNGVGFTALKVEGGILPPEFLTEVAALEAPRQSGADYGLSKSLSIKEEIARYWRIGNDLYGQYAERRPRRDLKASHVAVDDWLVPLLRTLLGYDDLAAAESVELEDRVFRLSHRACGGAVPLLLVTHDFDLDRADPRLGGNGRRLAPHGLMQEYLNAEAEALWGMVSNGSKLRILRDNPSLTRPSYIEADLDLVFTEELYPDFAALWLATHASRFRPTDDTPSSCIIETWRAKAHETGERARENLRDGVRGALRRLGNGFLEHPANNELRKALDGGDLTPEDYFQQLLRLVYRMLFLFTAEERDLLHAPDATGREQSLYAEGYALSRLRERALRRRHYDRSSDLWQGLQVTFRALARGAPALGLPPLGGLYREDECPDLDESAIANEDLLEAVRALAYFPSLSGRNLARINYRDMDTEELGSRVREPARASAGHRRARMAVALCVRERQKRREEDEGIGAKAQRLVLHPAQPRGRTREDNPRSGDCTGPSPSGRKIRAPRCSIYGCSTRPADRAISCWPPRVGLPRRLHGSRRVPTCRTRTRDGTHSARS